MSGQRRRELARAFGYPPVRALSDALDALDRELGTLARADLDHSVAHAKLGWWQEEAVRVGRAAPRHPLTRALAALGVDPASAAGPIEQRLLALARLVAGYVPASTADLEELVVATHGLTAGVLGATGGEAGASAARTLTLARGLAEVVLEVRAHAARGILYLPLAALDAAEVHPEDLTAQRLPPAVTALLDELADRAHSHWREAGPGDAGGDTRALRATRVEAALALRALDLARRRGYAPEHKAGIADAVGELLLAWRTARRGDAPAARQPDAKAG